MTLEISKARVLFLAGPSPLLEEYPPPFTPLPPTVLPLLFDPLIPRLAADGDKALASYTTLTSSLSRPVSETCSALCSCRYSTFRLVVALPYLELVPRQ